MKLIQSLLAVLAAAHSAAALNLMFHGNTTCGGEEYGSLSRVDHTDCFPISTLHFMAVPNYVQSISAGGYESSQNITFYRDSACSTLYAASTDDICIDAEPIVSLIVHNSAPAPIPYKA